MSLARLVVTAVRMEGRTKSEVARDYRVSRQWVHELVKRFDTEGEEGLEPRSRRPRASPRRTSDVLEDEIVELRKGLVDHGLDAGAHTIAFHLAQRHDVVPSVATIWRILSEPVRPRGAIGLRPRMRVGPSHRSKGIELGYGLGYGQQPDHNRFPRRIERGIRPTCQDSCDPWCADEVPSWTLPRVARRKRG